MSDKDNVKPIRKGVVVDNTEPTKPKPNTMLVEDLKLLTALAESGELQQFCYVGIDQARLVYTRIFPDLSDPYTMAQFLRELDEGYQDILYALSSEGDY